MELIFLVFVLIAALAIASCTFCVWLVATVVRGVVRTLVPRRETRQIGTQACANADCRCANPADARFCRRCGRSLPALLRVVASRAALL